MDTRTHSFTREDHVFESEGTRCAGWLYRPEGPPRPPVVVMAHGFAGERRAGLSAYAERFAKQGMAAFVFDYRTFGDSDGQPRHVVNPFDHVADWSAALEYVRDLRTVDEARIGLWGTSFSGGHVLVTAARNPDVRAVVAQVPYTGAEASGDEVSRSLSYRLWALRSGLYDLGRSALGLSPFYVPVVGPEGSRAVLNSPGAREGYHSLIPPGETWDNRCAARIFVQLPFYRPVRHAREVDCPVLFVLAQDDRLISAESVRTTAERVDDAEVMRVPVGHFDVYQGEPFERVVHRETSFLTEHLVSPSAAASG